MKFHLRLTIILAFGFLGSSVKSHAQSFTPHLNYSVQYDTDCYSVPEGATQILPDDFLNFTGAVDHDDGTVDSILVGFTFDYNGILSNSVNVNVNGWVSVNPIGKVNSIPVMPPNSNELFSPVLPNNTLAPCWGDHYYRTLESGYKPSLISYLTTFTGSPFPSSFIGTFYVEWRDLNVSDKNNPNSIASFQLIIHQNPKAYDQTAPDQRATIEFRYGPADTAAVIAGASIGIEDSAGFAYLNGLFETSQFNGDSSRLSTARTTCWPPPKCTPCIAIEFVPVAQPASDVNASLPQNYSLTANPNPFTQSATITFTSPASGPTQITILNLLGMEVARVYNGELTSGEHSFTWSKPAGLPDGMYICHVRMNGHVETLPLVLAR